MIIPIRVVTFTSDPYEWARHIMEPLDPDFHKKWKNEPEANLEARKKYGATIVRRFTGGGAVYHDYGNLNYAISIRNDHPLVPNDVLEIYKVLSVGIIEGLRLLGLTAEFIPVNDIQIDGKEVSGMAASLNWGAVFVTAHCWLVQT